MLGPEVAPAGSVLQLPAFFARVVLPLRDKPIPRSLAGELASVNPARLQIRLPACEGVDVVVLACVLEEGDRASWVVVLGALVEDAEEEGR